MHGLKRIFLFYAVDSFYLFHVPGIWRISILKCQCNKYVENNRLNKILNWVIFIIMMIGALLLASWPIILFNLIFHMDYSIAIFVQVLQLYILGRICND